ncbi:MAG: hypothetical protein V3T60_16790 [Candidatus Binatia bacterium]
MMDSMALWFSIYLALMLSYLTIKVLEYVGGFLWGFWHGIQKQKEELAHIPQEYFDRIYDDIRTGKLDIQTGKYRTTEEEEE